jgi:hypothetical protein
MTRTIGIVFAVGILILAGCRKQSNAMVVNGANLVDWGVVELSASTPEHLSLGNGKDCTVTARPLANGDLQITIETGESLRGGMNSPQGPIQVPMQMSQSQTMSVRAGVEIIATVFQTPVRFVPKFKGG